tara:strand:+ start:129 stop:311 length:183 start_codon:yes stop_codon:yes gene_type:complete
MDFFKKYSWQANLIGTIFFISRFLTAVYQWWHLFGTLIFFASFLQSYPEKKRVLANNEEE